MLQDKDQRVTETAYPHSRISFVVAKVLTKIIIHFLALAYMMLELGIVGHFRYPCVRGWLLSSFDAAQARLTAFNLSQLTNKGPSIGAMVPAFRGTML